MAFEKKEWQYRDLISADELNRVEDGIQEALDTEGADLSAVNESIQSEANTRQAADEEEAKTREEEDTAIRSEMQSGLDEKVDKTNVVNDLDVTDEGYVLDARVGAQIKEEIASGGTSDLITDVFMEQDSYSAGDYCIYNNVLYKFTADKEPGAWDESVVEATTVSGEIAANTEKIQENTDLIDSFNSGFEGSVYVFDSSTDLFDQFNALPDNTFIAGICNCYNSNAGASMPVNAQYFLLVWKRNDTYAFVIAYPDNNASALYTRAKTASGWRDWKSASLS